MKLIVFKLLNVAYYKDLTKKVIIMMCGYGSFNSTKTIIWLFNTNLWILLLD